MSTTPRAKPTKIVPGDWSPEAAGWPYSQAHARVHQLARVIRLPDGFESHQIVAEITCCRGVPFDVVDTAAHRIRLHGIVCAQADKLGRLGGLIEKARRP
jgi:hypothetical protein